MEKSSRLRLFVRDTDAIQVVASIHECRIAGGSSLPNSVQVTTGGAGRTEARGASACTQGSILDGESALRTLFPRSAPAYIASGSSGSKQHTGTCVPPPLNAAAMERMTLL